jgi:Tol biopolymer transport system component
VADFGGGNARQLTNDGVDAENPTAAQGGSWVVYVSTNPAQPGIWKIRLDATDATLLLAGRLNLPEISPDGQYALYSLNLSPTLTALRVLQVEDGIDVPFEILIERHPGATASLGRARWMPDGQAITFIGQDSKGLTGVFAQDFVPGRDTSASRRPVAGFDSQVAAESFGISPDATRIVVAGWEQLFSITRADGLQ